MNLIACHGHVQPTTTVYVGAMLIRYVWPSLTVANLQPMLSQLSMLGSQVMGQSQSRLRHSNAGPASQIKQMHCLLLLGGQVLTMDILLLPLQAYMCQTLNSAGGEPTLIHELKNMQLQLGLNIFLNFKSRVVGRGTFVGRGGFRDTTAK